MKAARVAGLTPTAAVAALKALITSSEDHLLVATGAASAGHVYVSIDDGTTWSIASGLSSFDGAPLGQALLQLGVNYGGDSAKVLCYGKPSYGMGIWLASAVSP